MLSVGQVYRDHLLFVIFFPDSIAVGALDTFRFLLRHTQGHQVASDQMAAQRNNVETGQTAILVHRDRGDACTEVDQRTPLQFLLFRQDQVCQRQRRNNNTSHIELDLLRHVRGYGMTKRRTANEQLIVGFNTRTPQTYRMGFRLVVEIINGSGYIQHVQHIGTILPAFLIQFLQHLFSHRTATEHFRHGMVNRTKRLASHPNIYLTDTGTTQFVFQFADQPHDLAGRIFYIIYTSSSYTGIGVLHFVGNDGKCPGRAFRAYHADHVRRAKVDGRYKVCVCHILYLLVQTI